MEGKTVLKLMIDERGKIKAFQLVRSSGWKMLDLTVMNAIIGCQILPEGRWVPSETYTAYRWEFDQGYTSPAVLEAKTCKSSDKLRIARSCEFMPAERSGKRIRNAGSLRFIAK